MVSSKPADMQTLPRTEAGLTRPDQTVCTSILFVRSDDRSVIKGLNKRLRDTRLLRGLSGKITARNGVAETQAPGARSTKPRAARRNQDSKSARREVLSVVEWSRGTADWAPVVGANSAQSSTAPDVCLDRALPKSKWSGPAGRGGNLVT